MNDASGGHCGGERAIGHPGINEIFARRWLPVPALATFVQNENFFSWSLGDFNYLVNSRTSLHRERGRVLKLHVDLRAALALLIHWLTLLDQNIFALEKGWCGGQSFCINLSRCIYWWNSNMAVFVCARMSVDRHVCRLLWLRQCARRLIRVVNQVWVRPSHVDLISSHHALHRRHPKQGVRMRAVYLMYVSLYRWLITVLISVSLQHYMCVRLCVREREKYGIEGTNHPMC